MKNQPAFPHSHLGISRGQLSYEDSHYEDGMTLRDYFAAKAMQAFLSNTDAARAVEPLSPTPHSMRTRFAEMAYAMADQMLRVRNPR